MIRVEPLLLRRSSSAGPQEHFDAVIPAAFGALGIRMTGKAIERLALLPPGVPPRSPQSAYTASVVKALRAYLRDATHSLAMPVSPQGTPFQQRVWQALRLIPLGETRTYGELANALGSSARAVGGACRANPIAIVIPCHRVVAASGLGGFSGEVDGEWLSLKRWLLTHEGAAGVDDVSRS